MLKFIENMLGSQPEPKRDIDVLRFRDAQRKCRAAKSRSELKQARKALHAAWLKLL